MSYSDAEIHGTLPSSLANIELARAGQSLETLVHDESWTVRLEVARQGYGLDILVHDKRWLVRKAVARQGYRLDILVHDASWTVRMEVAKQGFVLELLVNDDNWMVRKAVANQGYRLDLLVNDSDEDVRKVAEKLIGAKRHVVATNFGTYEGDLLLYTWNNKYLVISGCYETDSLTEWKTKCIEQLDMGTAIKYTKIMRAIIEEEVR